MSNRHDNLFCFFTLDDATAGVTKTRDRESPGGISPIADSMTLGRKLLMGFILVVHCITILSEIIRQNVAAFYVCGLQGENPFIIRDALNISQKQQEAFYGAEPQEFICVNPHLFGKPVYATFEELQIPGECDESMRQLDLEPFLKMVHATPPEPLSTFLPDMCPPSEPKGTEGPLPKLPDRGMEFMTHAGTGVPAQITKYYSRMGLSTTQGRRIVKRLEELGLIRIHACSTGKRGGQIKLPEVTDAGWAILKRNGLSPSESKTNGDWEHEAAARFLEFKGKTQGDKVSFEIDVDGLRLDVQWLDRKNGHRQFFNIGISRPGHEVDSIEKFFKLPASRDNSFTLVARDVDFAKKVKSILKQRDPKGVLLSRINIKLLTDFIPA